MANETESDAGIVRANDPAADAGPGPRRVRSGPSFGQRAGSFFRFLLRLVFLLIALAIISVALYLVLPLFYETFVLPVERNTTQVRELQTWQEQTQQDLGDLQTKLGTIESVQNQHDRLLNELDGRMDEIETEIAARTESLAALEEIQAQIQEQNEAASAELERQVDLLKSMELLSRARLFMYQSNFGLAEQDVQIARDVLVTVQEGAPDELAEDLETVLLHLDLALSNLPNFPVTASDDLDIAWQILLSGSSPTPTSVAGTPTAAGTLSATPNTTITPTPRVTATVQPTVTP